MKKIMMFITAFLFALVASGQAMAYFEDGDLVRVVYSGTGSGTEYATDLGNFAALTSASSANVAFNTNKIDFTKFGGATMDQLYVAYFMVTSTAGGFTGNYVWTSGPPDGQTGGGRNMFSQFTSGEHSVAAAYQVAGGGTANATLLQSNPASYWNIMNWAGGGRGQMIGFIPAGNADQNMAALFTTGYVDQHLYFYGTPSTSGPGIQIVLLRTFADGHTEFNPVPGCTASFSPSAIVAGQSATLFWTSTNDADGQVAYACTGDLASGTLSGASGSKDFSPAASQTCTLTVADASGTTKTCNAEVTVTTPDTPPTCAVFFSPSTINAGESSTLAWTSTNDADGQVPYHCTGDLGSGTLSGVNGLHVFSPTASQACVLTVSNSAGVMSTCAADVTVNPALPVCTASFSPSTINKGDTSKLTWTSSYDADGKILYVCNGNLGSGVFSGADGFQVLSPYSSQTCILTVANSSGVVKTCAADVTVSVPVPVCTASFSPETVTLGAQTSLSWTSDNDADGKIPYSCNGDLGSGTLSGESGSLAFSPKTAQTCILTVMDKDGVTATCSGIVTVDYPPPTCTASFSPATITAGQTSTLSWTSSNDVRGLIPFLCSGDLMGGTLIEALSPAMDGGSRSFAPTDTQTCTLSVANSVGVPATCTASVTVTPAPTCTASFSPATITAGQTSTLSWTSGDNADGKVAYSCTGNLGSGILSGANGSQTFSPTETQTCTLSAHDGQGTTQTCTATVNDSVNNCSATFGMDGFGFLVHVPVISYRGSYYWVDMRYMNTLDFQAEAAGQVTDMSKYGSCVSPVLNEDFSIDIPDLQMFGASYRLGLRYGGGSTFTITNVNRN